MKKSTQNWLLVWGGLALLPVLLSLFGWSNLIFQISVIFVYAVLALALNVAVGYAGMLHLGIAAFFAVGVYATAILTTTTYPFQLSCWAGLACSIVAAAVVGLMIGAPVLRLRGDYLALVTLGFGELLKDTLLNLDHITKGTETITSIPPPEFPHWFVSRFQQDDALWNWNKNPLWFFYFLLGCLAVVVWLLGNLERSRLGRAWVALREDELATQCMGINVARVKLSAFVVSAALAGLAGGLYVLVIGNSSKPDAYDFSISIITLSCVILGGLGSRGGVLLGVAVIMGFDRVLLPELSNMLAARSEALNPNNYKLLIYGLALVLMMRFRPAGLIPERRHLLELQEEHQS